MPDANEILDRLTGQQLPGGCDDCDAYQRMEQTTPGVYVLHVYHDDDCPTLAAHEGSR